MERQAGGVGVSRGGGVGAWTPLAQVRQGVDSQVPSAPSVVVVQLRRRLGRGQTGPHAGAAVGPIDHSGGGAALAEWK
jgi:hypothetical protein